MDTEARGPGCTFLLLCPSAYLFYLHLSLQGKVKAVTFKPGEKECPELGQGNFPAFLIALRCCGRFPLHPVQPRENLLSAR